MAHFYKFCLCSMAFGGLLQESKERYTVKLHFGKQSIRVLPLQREISSVFINHFA